jgi:hypothetical protein
MKRINNRAIINPFEDRPFQAAIGVKRGPDGKVVLDEFGNIEHHKRDMTTAHAVRNFLANAFDPKETTMVDSHHCLRILDVLRPFKLMSEAVGLPTPKYITLEDEDYTWFIGKAKDRAPKLYGVLAEVYVKAYEDLDKPSEPARLDDLSDHGANGTRPQLVSERV